MRNLLCLLMFVGFAGVNGQALSQQPLQRYQPSTPRFSPYFGLFLENQGLLPNYQQWVRPEQQRRQDFAAQNSALRYQGSQIRSLKQDVQAFQQPSGTRPTGTGSVYMNYSHYYPSLQRR